MGTSQNADTEGAPAASGVVRFVFIVCFCRPSTSQSKPCYSLPRYTDRNSYPVHEIQSGVGRF